MGYKHRRNYLNPEAAAHMEKSIRYSVFIHKLANLLFWISILVVVGGALAWVLSR